MDSQERHELKENELAEFLSNFGQWWEKYGNAVLLVLVIAAGSFAAYRLYNNWTSGAVQTAFGDLAATSSVQGYVDVAEGHRNRTVRTLAYLRGGDLALEQAVRPVAADPVADEDEQAAAPLSPDEALDRAEAMYSRALDAAHQPVYRANALIGLARVAETRGQWEQADGYYQQAEQLAAANHLPGLASQARRSQAMINDIRQPVVFAPESATPELPDFNADLEGLDFLAPDADAPTTTAPEDTAGDAPLPEPSADDADSE